MTLHIKKPQDNLNPVLCEITKFGGISGVQINCSKSAIFPLTDKTQPHQLDYPLVLEADELKYLGIRFTRQKEALMRINYGTAIDKITDNITKWIHLPLSMAVRISLIKMVILPKLLYLFINIPYNPGRFFFRTLRTQLTRLIWGGKQARLNLDTLMLPYHQGGYEVPNFERY